VVVWAFGTGEARLNGGQVKLQVFRVIRVRLISRVGSELSGFPQVMLNLISRFLVFANHVEIAQGLAVDWEVSHSCTILGRHVCDRCSVSQAQSLAAIAIVLNKLADDAQLAKHLRADKDEVSCRGVVWKLAGQFEADYFWKDH